MSTEAKMATTNVPADQQDASEGGTPEQQAALERLLKLAEEQGVKPMTREALEAMGSVWPEDESVDDFIAAVEQWRSEGGERELP